MQTKIVLTFTKLFAFGGGTRGLAPIAPTKPV